MKFRAFGLLLSLAFVLGCGSTSSNPSSSNSNAVRSYSGTASVGDFLTITLDPAALTFSYVNLSNGDTGTNIPYVVNANGTYTLQDPQGNLLAAYEVPSFGLLVRAAKAGPTHNTPAIVTAVLKGSGISATTWANQSFNLMQFRTSSGGLSIGSVVMNAQGDATSDTYWPYGASTGQTSFNSSSFSASNFTPNPSGAYMTMPDGDGGYDYAFGTPNGLFAVDTPNGAIIALEKTASKNFDPAAAGTYHGIYYQKIGALIIGPGNTESGTPRLGNATIVVASNAQVTVQDGHGATILQATLTPVADASYIVGTGELNDPCNGLFTFRLSTSTSQQDVFVTFVNHAVLFSSFTGVLPVAQGNTYNYLYGVGLK